MPSSLSLILLLLLCATTTTSARTASQNLRRERPVSSIVASGTAIVDSTTTIGGRPSSIGTKSDAGITRTFSIKSQLFFAFSEHLLTTFDTDDKLSPTSSEIQDVLFITKEFFHDRLQHALGDDFVGLDISNEQGRLSLERDDFDYELQFAAQVTLKKSSTTTPNAVNKVLGASNFNQFLLKQLRHANGHFSNSKLVLFRGVV